VTKVKPQEHAAVRAHAQNLVNVTNKNPLALERLHVFLGKPRSKVIDQSHANRLGVTLPRNEVLRPDGHAIKTVIYATGSYNKPVAAITESKAKRHNELVDDYNDKLDAAHRALTSGKRVMPEELAGYFSKLDWENLPSTDILYDAEKFAQVRTGYEEALAAGEATDVGPLVECLRPMVKIEARPAGTQLVERQSYAVDGSEQDIAIAHTIRTGKNGRAHVTPHMEGDNLVGSELLTPISLAAGGTLGVGGVLSLVPANPNFIDGTRVSRILGMFDQFRIKEMVFEYQAACPSTTAGSLENEYLDDGSDMLEEESGFSALRDADSRADSVESNYWSCCETRLTFPQQKWYYTGGQDVPGLTIPGVVLLQTMSALSGASGALNFGFTRMHYTIETRAPAIPGSIPQEFYTSYAEMVMTDATVGINLPVRVTPANSQIGATLTEIGVVYWGTLINADDPVGDPTWRTWQPGEDTQDNDLLIMGPDTATMLFWRVLYVAGVANICFFPSFMDALSADTYQSGSKFMLASANVVGGAKGFELQNIQGCYAMGGLNQL